MVALHPLRMAVFIFFGMTLALTSSCGGGSCSTVGAVHGFTITANIDPKKVAKIRMVEACVEGRCATSPVEFDSTISPKVTIQNDDINDGSLKSVAVYLLDSGRGKIAGGNAQVSPIKSFPNGQDCEPTSWLIHITASEAGLTEDNANRASG